MIHAIEVLTDLISAVTPLFTAIAAAIAAYAALRGARHGALNGQKLDCVIQKVPAERQPSGK